MPHESLADFLENLASAGELARVEIEADPDLEIAEIIARCARSGGPAILFDRPKGYATALVTNLLGTPARLARALGADSLEAVVETIAQRAGQGARRGWLTRLSAEEQNSAAGKFAPKTVKAAACQQVVRLGGDVDLAQIPAIRVGPEESQPALTAALVLFSSPDGERLALRRQSLPVLSRTTLALHAESYGPLRQQADAWAARGERMPVAVILGADPSVMLAAELPLEDVGEPYAAAGLLRGAPLEVVACRSHELPVPAHAEMILEGSIDLDEPLVEIPYLAAPSGFYARNLPAYRLHVAAITQRSNPVVPAIVYGRPPTELTVINQLAARLLLPHARAVAPEIVDLCLPSFAPGRSCAIVSIRKTQPHQARKVAGALWALDALRYTKTVIVVDPSVDVADVNAVMHRATACLDPARDVFYQDGLAEPLDQSVSRGGVVQKLGIDATAKLPEERDNQASDDRTAWPREIISSEETQTQVAGRWKQYGLPLPDRAP
ncbi:MAG: UbiD family decarboxylase [Pirellulales bacterium]